jgi:hypothetical protein
MLKINNSPSRHLHIGSKISGKNSIRQRHITKHISSKDNVTFEETVKLLNCLKNSYNNLKTLLSFLNVNKGRNKINK